MRVTLSTMIKRYKGMRCVSMTTFVKSDMHRIVEFNHREFVFQPAELEENLLDDDDESDDEGFVVTIGQVKQNAPFSSAPVFDVPLELRTIGPIKNLYFFQQPIFSDF